MIQKTESSKIGSILLIIGGVFQALIAIMHVAMFYGISKDPSLSAALKPSLHIFNAAVTATVLFFAYASFFRRRELMQPGIGRGTCLFIGLFYLQRVLVALVLKTPDLLFLGVLCLIAALYLLAPFMPQRAADRATEPTALGSASLS